MDLSQYLQNGEENQAEPEQQLSKETAAGGSLGRSGFESTGGFPERGILERIFKFHGTVQAAESGQPVTPVWAESRDPAGQDF